MLLLETSPITLIPTVPSRAIAPRGGFLISTVKDLDRLSNELVQQLIHHFARGPVTMTDPSRTRTLLWAQLRREGLVS